MHCQVLSELEPVLSCSPALSTCFDETLIVSQKLITKGEIVDVWSKVDNSVLSFVSFKTARGIRQGLTRSTFRPAIIMSKTKPVSDNRHSDYGIP